MTDKTKTKTTLIISERPPVVAVLGHVDHGKTTLLDSIRKTNVVAGEFGGITQHIGAYQVRFEPKNKKDSEKIITFIDTPGHEAFMKMRSRGAQIADIAILVVAADDGVMPQTKESISMIKSAGIPMIVALNKIDLPAANPDKVKQDLAKAGVQVEGFGGDIPIAAISAKTGKGIPELIELISLVAEMKGITGNSKQPFEAAVVETKIDKGKGMVATLIVKKGMLVYPSAMFDGENLVGKVRAMIDDKGNRISQAEPSKPVEVMGFTQLPQVGSIITAIPHSKLEKIELKNPKLIAGLPDFLKPLSEQTENKEHLHLVLKADTAGSLEAIMSSLDPRIVIVLGAVGGISEADILLAKASNAFVIGFNVKSSSDVEKLAQTEKVIIRTYTIIYNLLDELSEVVAGIKEVLHQERELGKGVVIAEFPFDETRIAGTRVTEGRIARGDQIKVMRGDIEIGKAKVKSIRHGRDEINKMEVGNECGLLLDKKVDFALNDAIIAFTV
jgi:translation initiation factor IF-2